MAVSALVRWLVRTFELLETHVVPAARSLVHLVRSCCASLPEKLENLKHRYLVFAITFRLNAAGNFSWFRRILERSPSKYNRLCSCCTDLMIGFYRLLRWLRSALYDALIYGVAACAFLALWRFAFRL